VDSVCHGRPTPYDTIVAAQDAALRLGFVALSIHSFEGSWPAPCERAERRPAFDNCSRIFWREDLRAEPPAFLRFYANGLFAVTSERIRRRPLSFYRTLLARLSGASPALCDGPDVRGRGPGFRVTHVGDCHVLEKSWHVVFGEPAEMPAPADYNPTRLPGTPVRSSDNSGGARYVEISAASAPGNCTVMRPIPP